MLFLYFLVNKLLERWRILWRGGTACFRVIKKAARQCGGFVCCRLRL